MLFSEYKKQRILFHHLQEKHKAPTIAKLLRSEGLSASRQGVAEFLKWYESRGIIKHKPGSGWPSKVTAEVKQIVEEQMRLDDETTATQLHALLNSRGYSLSLMTILRCCTSLGWTFRGSSYCQLIQNAIKVKRLEWAKENIRKDFGDVDECSIQLSIYRWFCCWKKGERPKNKPGYAYGLNCDEHVPVILILYVHYYDHNNSTCTCVHACNTIYVLCINLRAKHPVKVHVWVTGDVLEYVLLMA